MKRTKIITQFLWVGYPGAPGSRCLMKFFLVKLSARAMFSLEDLIRRRSSFKLILQPVFLTGTAGFLQNEGFKRKSAPKTEAAVFFKIESQK